MEIQVFDAGGNQKDLAWLRGKYGEFIIQDAAGGEGPVFKITTLREKVKTAATVVVRVVDVAGNPIEGVRVAWYWPDADMDPNAGPMGGVLPQMRPDRAVSGPTNANGDVGFGMGGGAYYWPDQGQIGPHAVWIHGRNTRSDLILGSGMVALTGHDHFDIEYTRLEEGEVPPPEPPPEPPPPEPPSGDLAAHLNAVVSLAEEAIGHANEALALLEGA